MSDAMSAIGTKRTSALCTAHVRFWGQSGHAVLHCTCPLMTQIEHLKQLVHFAPCLRKGRKEPEPISDAPLHDSQR